MFLNADVISAEEAKEFSRFLRVFNKNDHLYVEGEAFDDSFYLVRSGSVGVYRTVGGEECLIDLIRAPGFVGEIEVLVPGPRIGSVRVISDTLTSYRFDKSDIQFILSVPALSELLLKRLTNDLKDFSDRYVKNENSINRLLDEKENTYNNLVNLFSVINLALDHFPDENTLSEKCAAYLLGIRQMIKKYLAIKLPELNYLTESDNARGLRTMYEENLIPDEMTEILIRSNNK